MDFYREEILDHYKNPRNFGELEDATHSVREANASCGDLVELQLKVENEKIVDVAFKGMGCALSMAAASLLTEAIRGKSVLEVRAIDEKMVNELLGVEVSATRKKCVLLPLRGLQKALSKDDVKNEG